MTTTATVPPVDSVAPGLRTRAEPGTLGGAISLRLGIGAVALIASLVGLFLGEESAKQFYHSYLVAYMFGLSLVLGAMFFVLIQHLSRAGWSVVVRRLAENVMGAMPLMALLFVPLIFGHGTLYHWVHLSHLAPGDAGYDPVIAGKTGYLNSTFFFVRVALYFAVWIGIARWFRKTSIQQDQTGDPALTLKMARVAAPCMLLFALSLTFAAIDWLMSLDPHWFSTIWGVYYFAGSFMSFMAMMALLLMWLRGKGLMTDTVTTEHFHDVGKLMFAFMVFWTYIAFSQYMLIWYANLPEETLWYQHHLEGNWNSIGETLMVGHFLVPFAFLMSRHIKRARATLAVGAVFLLLMHLIDMHWVVMPMLHHHGLHLTWLDFTTVIAVLGLLTGVVLRNVQGASLVPERDPRLRESLDFVNH